MTKPTKEEIARVDLAHRRADESLEMHKRGVVLGDRVTVLHADENEGTEAVWTLGEIETWPEDKARLAGQLALSQNYVSILNADASHAYHSSRKLVAGQDRIDLVEQQTRGRMMYPQSAAYLAAHPKRDPYAASAEHEKSVGNLQAAKDDADGKRKQLITNLKAEMGTSVLLEHFPSDARNPR